MDKVLPCPLCGNAPRVVNLAGWEVICKCGLMFAGITHTLARSKKKTVALWNTRAAPSEAAVTAAEDYFYDYSPFNGPDELREAIRQMVIAAVGEPS